MWDDEVSKTINTRRMFIINERSEELKEKVHKSLISTLKMSKPLVTQ
jgi:hypothetical protein